MTKQVAWLSVVLAAGCYDPKIEDGFACDADGECPDGFACCDGACHESCQGDGGAEGESEAESESECVARCGDDGPPVCGADGETVANACAADCVGIDVACPGNCPCTNDCACLEVDAPVCGSDGLTYASACEAECARVEVACPGTCEAGCEVGESESESEGECGCYECPCGAEASLECDPVCAADGMTYANEEQAVCAGRIVSCHGECPCDCEDACVDSAPPVCTEWGAYSNECEASCAGAEFCIGACSCGELGGECAPVCGEDGVTYANEAQTACAGVPLACTGACPCAGGGSCNLLDQTTCPSDEVPMGCYVEPGDQPTCAPAGWGGPGSGCGTQTDCAAGHVCTQSGAGVEHCAPFCAPAAECPDGIDPGIECVFLDGLPEDIWACVYP